MWFKNILMYRLERPWTLAAGSLEELLAEQPLQPCSAMTMQTNGWVAPSDSGALVESLGRHLLVALGTEQKLLPGAVINDAARDKAEQFEQQRGFKPGRKMMREIKEQVTAELLPRAFSRRSETRAWIDGENQRLIVEASSAARAEALVEQLRDRLGDLSAIPVDADPSPSVTMTSWLASGHAPGRFAMEDECELASGDATRSVIRYLRHPLDGAEIRRHLEAGMRVTKLLLTWNDRLSFVLNEQLQLKRISFLDMDEDREQAAETDLQFEAEFALMTGELSRLLSDLGDALGTNKLANAA
jgi:recombination associated protein RdgC